MEGKGYVSRLVCTDPCWNWLLVFVIRMFFSSWKSEHLSRVKLYDLFLGRKSHQKALWVSAGFSGAFSSR